MIVFDEDVEIIFVSNYYDWPLSGVCRYNGVTYWFDRTAGEDDWLEQFELTKLSALQRFNKWLRRTMFGVCVGFHWHYKDGKRAHYFKRRWPKWFWGMLSNLYYKRAPWRYPFFEWEW